MFKFFKKRPANALDEFIFAVYGNPPPKKRANLIQSIELAHQELLTSSIDRQEVQMHAEELNSGPIPYSTHDLALAVALNFFKRPENSDNLRDAQILARLQAVQWYQQGLVAPMLVRNFEQVLYEMYN